MTIYQAVKRARRFKRRPLQYPQYSHLEAAIISLQHRAATKPARCALPKKKQRELGMLPPVESIKR